MQANGQLFVTEIRYINHFALFYSVPKQSKCQPFELLRALYAAALSSNIVDNLFAKQTIMYVI